MRGALVNLEDRIRVHQERIEVLRGHIKDHMSQIEHLQNLPEEPDVEPAVIWFEKTFADGRTYTYAAVKADGLWYTSGPRTPKGYTWENLMTWVGVGTEVWLATDFKELL